MEKYRAKKSSLFLNLAIVIFGISIIIMLVIISNADDPAQTSENVNSAEITNINN